MYLEKQEKEVGFTNEEVTAWNIAKKQEQQRQQEKQGKRS